MVGFCRQCASCRAGQEQDCAAMVGTYGDAGADGTVTQGGYAAAIVVGQDFVLRIPDGLVAAIDVGPDGLREAGRADVRLDNCQRFVQPPQELRLVAEAGRESVSSSTSRARSRMRDGIVTIGATLGEL
jgi:hypothetical protein